MQDNNPQQHSSNSDVACVPSSAGSNSGSNANEMSAVERFLYELHAVMEECDQAAKKGMVPALSWAPNIDGIMFTNKEDMETNIIPKYFPNISKVASFQRALNRAGIRKDRTGEFKGVWRHETASFFRGSHAHDTRLEAAASRSSSSRSNNSNSSNNTKKKRPAKKMKKEDQELSAFFAIFANSITDEMVNMHPDDLAIVRTSKATICVPKSVLKKQKQSSKKRRIDPQVIRGQQQQQQQQTMTPSHTYSNVLSTTTTNTHNDNGASITSPAQLVLQSQQQQQQQHFDSNNCFAAAAASQQLPFNTTQFSDHNNMAASHVQGSLPIL